LRKFFERYRERARRLAIDVEACITIFHWVPAVP
jgi:hypothetical protein